MNLEMSLGKYILCSSI